MGYGDGAFVGRGIMCCDLACSSINDRIEKRSFNSLQQHQFAIWLEI
jgi:hypothetical protein